MGFMFAVGECGACGKRFSFNPDLVPSVRDSEGVKQPICKDCIDRANPERIRRGLNPITPLPGAYEPGECT